MNLELDAILYDKDKWNQALTIDDFNLFKENDYLLETEYTGEQKFKFSIDDIDHGGSSYGALFCFKNGDFDKGFILRLDHEITPEILGKNSCDKVYYTSNISVYRFTKHKSFKKTIKIILSMIAPIIITGGIGFAIAECRNFFANTCASLALVMTWIAFWTLGIGDYKILKTKSLKEYTSKYIQIGKNDGRLEEYCHQKEEEKYK